MFKPKLWHDYDEYIIKKLYADDFLMPIFLNASVSLNCIILYAIFIFRLLFTS